MENDSFIWLLLALPVVFGLGWMASRLDLRQLRTANRSAPKAYFMGLNYLLNEQQDKAIDAFIEAVQKDPDTTELHFALGNLFRRRGEYERAVRVHRHLLSRNDLSAADRDRAQHALAQDFLKAGLLDHAEEALRALKDSSYEAQAQLALLGIYERSRDWVPAGESAHALEAAGQQDFARQRAHYVCERAQEAHKQGEPQQAMELLQQAMQIAPQAARPRLQQALLLQAGGEHAKAFELLQQAMRDIPAFAPLLAAPLAQAALDTGRTLEAHALLERLQQQSPSIDLVEALARLDQQLDPAASTAGRYLGHLEQSPSLIAATRWLDLEKLQQDPHREVVDRALDKAIRPLGRYRCAACGFEAQQHYWHCPGCQSWDSYPPRRVEEL